MCQSCQNLFVSCTKINSLWTKVSLFILLAIGKRKTSFLFKPKDPYLLMTPIMVQQWGIKMGHNLYVTSIFPTYMSGLHSCNPE